MFMLRLKVRVGSALAPLTFAASQQSLGVDVSVGFF